MRTERNVALRIAVVSVLLLALTACGGLRETFGIGTKRPPDEFSVVKRAPLVVPPNYNLRPPRPGAPRPQELEPKQAARNAVVSSAGGTISRRDAGRAPTPAAGAPAAGTASASEPSAGEMALMKKAGTEDVDPNIRQIIDSETSVLVAKSESFTDRLLFWRDPERPGQVIDARKESTRIRENRATGDAVTSGSTPVIRHRRRGILEGLF
ncbi:MAG: DUF3035 domain-containing protein [Alphaproteobacteria bacterium]|nr:DUF3035 domain-containing protein [Alphaproteobacteria bacterium]